MEKNKKQSFIKRVSLSLIETALIVVLVGAAIEPFRVKSSATNATLNAATNFFVGDGIVGTVKRYLQFHHGKIGEFGEGIFVKIYKVNYLYLYKK